MPEATFTRTVGELLDKGARLLAEAGCDSPRLDAELLVAEALGVNRAALVMDPGRAVGDELARLGGLMRRRCTREPMAYILGRKDFRYLTVAVDPRVLIPRPETELLVEVGLTLPAGARVVDVGTGSGAVALALKQERPDLTVSATDVSEEALEVARQNAARLGLDVSFAGADLLDGLAGPFDAVLANLPYVEADAVLEPELTDFEPPGALYAGSDGLEVIRRLVEQLDRVPLVALEVGAGQAPAVTKLLRRAGFSQIEVRHDLAGHARVVLGRR